MKNRATREIALVIIVVALAGLACATHPSRWTVVKWCDANSIASACKSNLKNIGTALEMYSTDNQGRFPKRLDALVPRYLGSLPTCPQAELATYADGYTSASNPDAYTVVCAGFNHGWAHLDANKPDYCSTCGISER